MNMKVLFISYDGMTDPLGQSQVIPYLAGLSKKGYEITILSFEKPAKLRQLGAEIGKLLKDNNIGWVPLRFHMSPPVISKAWDVRSMNQRAKQLHRMNKYDLIHCRSYIAAAAGLRLKRKTGVKLLFDMRGFWADEKAEGGNWNRSYLFWRIVYRHYKNLEKKLIAGADHIISLTQAGKEEISRWPLYSFSVPITVIPCCADTQLFSITDKQQQQEAKQLLKIPETSFVLGYLGSLGTWYMLDEMLDFFKRLQAHTPRSVFLFVTNSDHEGVRQRMKVKNITADDVRILTVNYKEVPRHIKAADACISFIRPVYSKAASSPTKNGEMLCMGIPVVLNDIGDSAIIIDQCRSGIVIKEFNENAYDRAIHLLDGMKNRDPASIRNCSLNMYSLDQGIQKYESVYQSLLAGK
jgi:glycosyltransferase involved in cell wall biosynthesis